MTLAWPYRRTLAAVDQYRTLHAGHAPGYNFDEPQLNILGYELMKKRRLGEAVGVLKLNAEAYPNSSNAYDSLGEAYMTAGDSSDAIANYRKSLALDPSNANAVTRLAKLGVPSS